MTSYSNYHKKDNDRKRDAGYKKITFELDSEEATRSYDVKEKLKNKGNPKTNKTLYMEAIYKNEQEL